MVLSVLLLLSVVLLLAALALRWQRVQDLLAANAGLREQLEDQQRIQQDLSRKVEDLKRSNQELEQFAYVASHDLQAPLRGISGFSKLLQKRYAGRLDAEADEYLDFIHGSTQQMQQLITGVLAFAKLGRQGEPQAPVDLNEVMEHALQRLFFTIEERKAEIRYGELPRIIGQRVELVQLFQNLLSNGLKFQPGEAPRILVNATREGGHWCLSFTDFGIGIDKAHQDKVFRIFQRLHSSDEYEGTGIGLAICQKIAERHGGSIRLESEPGQGSTFHVSLAAELPQPATA